MGFHRKVALIIIFGLGAWIAGIIITPLLAASQGILWQKMASFMYFFYQPVCHQLADRSFFLDGFTMTVCVRCFCFYLGGLLLSGIYLFKNNIQMWKLSNYGLLITPAVLDFLLEKFYLYSNITGLRLLTGLLLGLAIFHLLLVSLTTTAPTSTKISTG